MTDKEIEANFKVIRELIGELKKVADRHEVNTDKEIGDLHDFTLELAKVGATVDAIHSNQKRVAENTADAVEERTQPILEETHALRKTIRDKKTIAFKNPGWISRLKFW